MACSGCAVSPWSVTEVRLCRDVPLPFDQAARKFDTAGCLSYRLCKVLNLLTSDGEDRECFRSSG